MHRIDGDGAVTDQNGAGRDGFSDDYPNRTVVTDSWANDVQENIARAIELAGITLVKGTFTQLYDAISGVAARAALRAGTHFLSTIHAMPGVTSAGAATWSLGAGIIAPGAALISRLDKPADGCGVAWEIPVLVGTELTAIRASVIPGAGRGTGNRMELYLYEQDLTTMAFTPASGVASVEDAGGTSLQWMPLGAMPGGGIAGNANMRYFAVVLPGNTGASAPDIVYGVEYTTALT